MATCIEVSADRRSLFIGYPSEPVLAVAAANFMNDPNALPDILDALISGSKSGEVEAGYRGEQVARIIILLARDEAAKKKYPNNPLALAKPVTVYEFLSQLIGSGNMNDIRSATGKQLEPEVLNALITMTHFVPLTYIPDSTDLSLMLHRCAAAVMKRNAKGIDALIPALTQSDKHVLIHVQVLYDCHLASLS